MNKKIEPELITIIEGPTPEFRPSPHRWNQSIFEGPDDRLVGLCELRTMNGEDILGRCLDAWDEGRPVKLDYPDRMRLRQRADVVAMRLQELEEGPLLLLWVSLPLTDVDDDEDFDFDDFDDEDDGFSLI